MSTSINPDDILHEAADVFAAHDRAHAELRRLEADLARLCLAYGDATKRWGYAPHHLRRAVEARLGLRAA